MSTTITDIKAREIIDSRGNPTVEAELTLSDGSTGRAIVPSGASTGIHEALELRDGDQLRFLGKGVLKAVAHIDTKIRPALLNKRFTSIHDLDRIMLTLDGTPQKKNLGANAILAVSMAFAHALAHSQKRPLFLLLNEMMGVSSQKMKLPVPLMNIINGGLHANNSLEFQEFMIVPHGFGKFSEALRAGCEVFQHLKKLLEESHNSTAVGDEGGFAPNLESNECAITTILEAIKTAGYRAGSQVAIALDVASSSFLEGSAYKLRFGDKTQVSSNELIELYSKFIKSYPIVSIEDGLGEEDWSGWTTLTQKLGGTTQLIGDDLFVTQSKHLTHGIETKAANAILIKVNQVGSLSETFDTMALAERNHYRQVVSHRSGETEDVTIAHLAVGSGAGQIKTGSLSRSERTAKYNELLRIESFGTANGLKLGFESPFQL
ncbi:MAG: phosphopyruvate hydratase [Deltaproteobacteria bacterium]|nr:phosphopyruvate hydratase [Deltaproteobacteria bacterium]MBI3294576.1 phosphopyruvate hydratase [Deltaproteobacteria bacterium]